MENECMTNKICEEVVEVHEALEERMWKGLGADKIYVEAWKCLGNCGAQVLCRLLNNVLNTENMPSEWKRSILVSFLRGKEMYKNAVIIEESNCYHTPLSYGKECRTKADRMPQYT